MDEFDAMINAYEYDRNPTFSTSKGLNKKTKTIKEPKIYKEANIMKGRSDLKKKGDKYTVDTEMNIKKGLDAKTKRALKKSVMEELNKQMKGGAIVLDLSSDEEMDGKGLYAGRARSSGRGLIEDLRKLETGEMTANKLINKYPHLRDADLALNQEVYPSEHTPPSTPSGSPTETPDGTPPSRYRKKQKSINASLISKRRDNMPPPPPPAAGTGVKRPRGRPRKNQLP